MATVEQRVSSAQAVTVGSSSRRQSQTEVLSPAESNRRFRWLILLALTTATILEVLDTTIINVALPQMAGNLGATTQEIAWVSTGYIVSNVIVLPMTAFLTARFGRRLYMVSSVILFTVASLFSGISGSLGEIVFWRVLQGAGGAALLSTAQAALMEIFDAKEQAIVQPLFLLGIVVAPTIGPTLGGSITDAASWNWCFLINVPIGVVSAVLLAIFMHDTTAAKPKEPVDWLGIGLLTLGLGALQFVLEEGERRDWFTDPTIVLLSFISGLSLAALVAWQVSPKNQRPVIDFRVLKNRSLTAAIVLFVTVGVGLYGLNYLYPVLAQSVQGLSSYQTGLNMLPGGIATALSIVFCGILVNQPNNLLDARALTLLGVCLSASSLWLFSRLTPQMGSDDTYWPLVLRGLSIGFLMLPVNQLAITSLKQHQLTQGAGLMSLARQLGGSLGIAAIATFVDSHARVNRANLVADYSLSSSAFQSRLTGVTGSLAHQGFGPTQAHQAAVGVLDQLLNSQALTMSFNQTFLMLLVFTIVTAPAILLLGRPKSISPNPSVAVH